jgi:DNA-binding CsgD family transcriptional regulator
VTLPRDHIPDDLAVSISDDGEYAIFAYTLPRDVRARLTPAELAVALLLLEGKTYEEIAAARRRAVRTIANQVASVFRKLGISSRSQLVAQYGDDILLR